MYDVLIFNIKCHIDDIAPAGKWLTSDHTYKLASKVTVVTKDGVRVKAMEGGIYVINNEEKQVVSWVSSIITPYLD